VDPTQWGELIESCGIGEDDMVTGAVLLLRTKNMETGQIGLCTGRTEDTDQILLLGMLHAAIEIEQGETWKRVEDGG
jgi:hypothetical protein